MKSEGTITYQQYARNYKEKKLCDIYRWKTSLSPAYLNNKDECDGMISIWKIMWTRMQNIMRKVKDKEQLDDREIGIYKTFKKLVKKEKWEYISNNIINNEPSDKLHKYRYEEFKEITKLMLTFRTYFEESYERQNDIGFVCPTCGKISYSKGQLTIHQKHRRRMCKTLLGGDQKMEIM